MGVDTTRMFIRPLTGMGEGTDLVADDRTMLQIGLSYVASVTLAE